MNEYIVLNIIYIMSVIFYVSFCKYTFFFLTLQIVPIKNIFFFFMLCFVKQYAMCSRVVSGSRIVCLVNSL